MSEELAVTLQPAVITADFDSMSKALDKYLEDYDGMTRAALSKLTVKELRPLRADLNSRSKELNAARIGIKKQYTAPLVAFEARIKELDERIQEPCKLIDEVIKEKEQSERDERKRYLENWYYDFCSANGVEKFAECVPFERILEKEWLNKSFQLGKACNEMDEKLQKILTDYQAVRNSVYYDPQEAELVFFETLSMAEVVKRDLAKKEAQSKAEALRAEILANQQTYPVEEQTMPQTGLKPPQTPKMYSFTISCTEEQREELVQWFKERGIRGTFKEAR